MSDIATIEHDIMDASQDEGHARDAYTIECTGSHDSKVLFQSDAEGCSEHMHYALLVFLLIPQQFLVSQRMKLLLFANANDAQSSIDAMKPKRSPQ